MVLKSGISALLISSNHLDTKLPACRETHTQSPYTAHKLKHVLGSLSRDTSDSSPVGASEVGQGVPKSSVTQAS